MTDKVFNLNNYATKDNTRIHYSRPKKSDDGLKVSRATYIDGGDKMNICFETERIDLENGLNKKSDGNYYLDLKLDEKNQVFFEFMAELDELGASKTWEKSKEWFGVQMDQDKIDNYYKNLLRSGKNSETYVRLNLNEKSVILKNQYGNQINIKNFETKSSVVVKIRYSGLSFYKQMFMPIYSIVQLTSYDSEEKTSYDFYNSDNELPDLVDNYLEDTEKNSQDEENKISQDEENKTSQDEKEETKVEEISVVNEVEVEVRHEVNDESGEEVLEKVEDLGEFLKENVGERESDNVTQNEIPVKKLLKSEELTLRDLPFDEPTTALDDDENDTVDTLRRKLLIAKGKYHRVKSERSTETSFTETSRK